MRRDWPLLLAGLGVAALTAAALVLGLEAWAGLYPRSPALARASRWPVVGDWVAGVRRRHLGPPAPRRPRLVEPARVAAPARPLAPPLEGGDQGIPDLPAGVWPEVWLAPGDLLRARPAEAAPVVVEATAIANVSVLEARGEWRRVRWHGHEGWVRERPQTSPPLGSAVEPVHPQSGRVADPELLAAAREVLGPAATDASPRHLGPYPLLTDVEEPALLLLLDRAAGGVEDAYRARYGLQPVGVPAETVVFFRSRASYADYLERTGGPRAVTGHASRGVVAFYREGRLIEDLRGTLVHEIVHLVARRAIGPALPPWLDEGMADDLGESRVGDDGRLLPGTLSATTLRAGEFFETHGGQASLLSLRHRLAGGGLLPLERLTALDGEAFHAVSPPALAYAEASFFVRYLLSGELATRFRGFLGAVAAGTPPIPEALQAALGVPWPTLDTGFAAWITDLPVPDPAASPGGAPAPADNSLKTKDPQKVGAWGAPMEKRVRRG